MTHKSTNSYRPKGGGRKHARLIPIEKREAVVRRMHKAGKKTSQIAYALGWTWGEGHSMVKRIAIKLRLRRK